MPAPTSVQYPHCRATLKLKSSETLGKTVRCPKCKQPFLAQPAPEPDTQGENPQDEFDLSNDASSSDAEHGNANPLPVLAKRSSKKKARQRKAAQRRRKARQKKAEAMEREFAKAAAISAVVWVNAILAVAVCVVDSGIEFLWMIAHWGEIYEQTGVLRLAIGQLGRPLFLIITALIVWFQAVFPRDIFMRGAVILFGGGYLFLFGVIAMLVALLAEGLYERPIYAIQWSVIYLGISLLLFAAWGYGPETTLQRAERLTSMGRYSDALTAVNEALDEDPNDEDALELERTLRDLIRWR